MINRWFYSPEIYNKAKLYEAKKVNKAKFDRNIKRKSAFPFIVGKFHTTTLVIDKHIDKNQ